MSKRVEEYLERFFKYRAYLQARKAIEDLRNSHKYKGKDMPPKHWVNLKIELASQLIRSLSQEQKKELMESLEREPENYDDFFNVKEDSSDYVCPEQK